MFCIKTAAVHIVLLSVRFLPLLYIGFLSAECPNIIKRLKNRLLLVSAAHVCQYVL